MLKPAKMMIASAIATIAGPRIANVAKTAIATIRIAKIAHFKKINH